MCAEVEPFSTLVASLHSCGGREKEAVFLHGRGVGYGDGGGSCVRYSSGGLVCACTHRGRHRRGHTFLSLS